MTPPISLSHRVFVYSEQVRTLKILTLCPYGTATERARKRINSAVNKFVNNDGHCVIHHPNIRAREKNLYRFHGTHLSDIGVNIYLNNIQGAVETFMSSNQTRSFLPTKLSIDVYFSERFS
jgi:hypothetical protein